MYLAEFRRENVAPGRWTAKAAKKEQMDVVFAELDATLNSWKEAHALFAHHQQGDRVTHAAHKAFHFLVKRAMPRLTSYIAHQQAYALLVVWIANRKTEESLNAN